MPPEPRSLPRHDQQHPDAEPTTRQAAKIGGTVLLAVAAAGATTVAAWYLAPTPGGSNPATVSAAQTEPATVADPGRPMSDGSQRSGQPSNQAGSTPAAQAATEPAARTASPAAAAANTAGGQINIPAHGMTLPMQPVGVADDGQMAVPENPKIAGVYSFGAQPGDAEGVSVIAAHIDDREFGVGPFAQLGKVSRGEQITLTWQGKLLTYVVTDVQRTPKSGLETAALFTRTGPHKIHVITCGGDFNRQSGHYTDNIIVTAEPAG